MLFLKHIVNIFLLAIYLLLQVEQVEVTWSLLPSYISYPYTLCISANEDSTI